MQYSIKLNEFVLTNNFFKFARLFLLVIGFYSVPVCSVHAVTSNYVVIDDYEGTSVPGRPWFYTRMGGDRGVMSGGNGSATVGNGQTSIAANSSGWAGVWTHMYHIAMPHRMLNTHNVLGPYIKSEYQVKARRIKVKINDGHGQFKIEVVAGNGSIKFKKEVTLTGGQRDVFLSITNSGKAFNIKQINLIAGTANSWANVDELGMEISTPEYTTEEAVFLYSYAHLSYQFDNNLGLVGERASWEVGSPPVNGSGRGTAGVPATALFALASATGAKMGYVDDGLAKAIVQRIHDKMQTWPTYKGLLPHFLQMNSSSQMVIRPGSEYSSVDTSIALVALILADKIMGINSVPIKNMATGIDWAALTSNYTEPVSHGYDDEGNLLSYINEHGSRVYVRWDVFGSESYIVGVLHAAATGRASLLNPAFQYAPTWDASGFNDEMAALFFPVNDGSGDVWGNDWEKYRSDAREKQKNYLANKYGSRWDQYINSGMFGFSASEVPEKWKVAEDKEYKAWGVGGQNVNNNETAHDGVNWPGVNRPIVAPHYAAMIAAEEPVPFRTLFNNLIQNKKVFTPLNNVESLHLGANSNDIYWNSLKGSWNLGLQILGVGRALMKSKNQNWVYNALRNDAYLKYGFDIIGLDYCTAKGNDTSDEWIRRVNLGSIDNYSQSNGGYGDFTSYLKTNLKRRRSKTINLSPGYSGTKYNEHWRVYIDWNQDGDFNDRRELVYYTESASSSSRSGSFTTPKFAKRGHTRMRVVMRYARVPGPCGSFDYGEVEDYTVNIR